MTHRVDVVVLGAGPGGYVAAIRAAQLGLSVAVVEEKYWGGVCLNIGCIPSKALLRNAEIASTYRHHAADFGIGGNVTFDFGIAHDRSRQVAEGRVKGIHFLMNKNGITELHGRGIFTGTNSMDVRLSDGVTEQINFEHAIIATGSHARMLPGVERSGRIMTYEESILDREQPASLLVVGAGAIGMELSFVACAYGAEVTVVEYLERALPNEDPEVSKEIAKTYKKLGITLLTSTQVESIIDHGDRVAVTLSQKGIKQSVDVDRVLVAIGFAPNVEAIGLQSAGVALNELGAIAIDERMRTNVPHIYAIGDVTMKLQLAHVAEAQGVVAAETIAGVQTMELGDYRMMPRATFTQPQVASFGLTEAEARNEGHDVTVVKFPFSANGKAHGLGEPAGFVKLIAGAKHGELLGGHMIGPDVSELLPELTLAQKWDLGAFELARNVHTHPTLGEALQEAFHGLTGHMINL